MHDECDIGPCRGAAIVQFTGVSGRSWRTAKACPAHAQRLADYCAKPVEEWRDDYTPVAQFDHATRTWVPTPENA